MIADSSVLILFARAGRLDLLRRTFRHVEMPAAVRAECIDAAPGLPDALVLKAAVGERWLRSVPVAPRRVSAVSRRYPNLGLGEAAVLALALQRAERAVLLDEAPARRVALLEGIEPVGSLGVLALAHRRGQLRTKRAVGDAVQELLSAGLWVAPEVLEAFWKSLGGRP